MKFTKMQGIGNDYVYVDCFKEQVERPGPMARFVSNRHFGIGSDGLILICPSKAADCRMEMYNADGSQGIMCGNGVRCVGKYVYDHGLVPPDRRQITVETLGGIKTLELWVRDGKVAAVTVDMGEGTLSSRLPEDITVNGKKYQFVGIEVGNPHAVNFMEEIDHLDLERIGPGFELHERFRPHRVNTEFIQIVDRSHLRMRVWERGSGETWACGTGAAASVMAAVLMGYADDQAKVSLRGGTLLIRYDRQRGRLYMTGPAAEVFSGTIEIPPVIPEV